MEKLDDVVQVMGLLGKVFSELHKEGVTTFGEDEYEECYDYLEMEISDKTAGNLANVIEYVDTLMADTNYKTAITILQCLSDLQDAGKLEFFRVMLYRNDYTVYPITNELIDKAYETFIRE